MQINTLKAFKAFSVRKKEWSSTLLSYETEPLKNCKNCKNAFDFKKIFGAVGFSVRHNETSIDQWNNCLETIFTIWDEKNSCNLKIIAKVQLLFFDNNFAI